MARTHSGEFDIITCYLGGYDDGNNDMEAAASKTIYKGISKKRLYWSSRTTLKSLATVIDENEVDLVVCQFRRTIPIGVLAAFFSKRKPKTIAILHGIVGGKNSLSRKMINFLVYKRLNKVVSVSEFGVSDIVKQNIGLSEKKIVAIPNGLNCKKFTEEKLVKRSDTLPHYHKDDFIILMVGRLAPVKNHVRVLHALVKLKAQLETMVPERVVRLVIAGQGPAENQIKSIIDELNLNKNVELLGFRKDIPDLLKVVDAYLMPSAREGLPMALMEAMVSELLVITSNRAGMKELVPDESIGYLVDPDSIDSIYQGMLRALQEDPDTRQAKIDKARQRVLEKYSSDVMINHYDNLYKKLLT